MDLVADVLIRFLLRSVADFLSAQGIYIMRGGTQ
jgi:hypothetical protein